MRLRVQFKAQLLTAFILALAAFQVGCGPSGGDTEGPQLEYVYDDSLEEDLDDIHEDEEEDDNSYIDEPKAWYEDYDWSPESVILDCATNDCPQTIGVLLSANEEVEYRNFELYNVFEVQRCTAFMIAPDIIMTNRHCIEADMKGYWFKTVSVNDNQSQLREVEHPPLRKSPGLQGIYGEDYAFLRLKKPIEGLSLIPLTDSSPKSGDSLLSYVVNAGPSDKALQLDRLECMVSKNSWRFPLKAEDNLNVFQFEGCLIRTGNSGAPLLNDAGNVVAILQSGRTDSVQQGNYKKDKATIGLATNIACVGVTEEQDKIIDHCSKVTRESVAQAQSTFLLTLNEDVLNQAEDEINKHLTQTGLRFAIVPHAYKDNYKPEILIAALPVPLCVEDPDLIENSSGRQLNVPFYEFKIDSLSGRLKGTRGAKEFPVHIEAKVSGSTALIDYIRKYDYWNRDLPQGAGKALDSFKHLRVPACDEIETIQTEENTSVDPEVGP